jgi:hypothetical protein
VVAHRLYAPGRRILVLDGGRLVEPGARDELVARRDPYVRIASDSWARTCSSSLVGQQGQQRRGVHFRELPPGVL